MEKVDHTILDSDFATQESQWPPHERLYTVGTIVGLTFFTSALGGSVLVFYNYRQLGRGRSGLQIVVGFGISVVCFVVPLPVPEPLLTLLYGVMQATLMYFYVRATQGPQIADWARAGGETASRWLPIGVVIGTCVFVIALLAFAEWLGET